jgi:hypothetical protein
MFPIRVAVPTRYPPVITWTLIFKDPGEIRFRSMRATMKEVCHGDQEARKVRVARVL